MKPIEKAKAEKIILKLETGEFDENDVDNIFMRLRAHSYGHHIFREVAHFVAHNDERNQGIAVESLEAFYLSFKYFFEHFLSGPAIDIAFPFPLYIKKLMKYQVDRCKDSELKEKFNLTKSRLKSNVDSFFGENKKHKTAYLKKNIPANLFEALKYVMDSFGGRPPAFDQEQIISELVAVIKANKLKVNENELRKHSERIAVCVALLLHQTTFDVGAHKPGSCRVSCEKTSVSIKQQSLGVEGNLVELNESHGNLLVFGTVLVDRGGVDVMMSFPLITTTAPAENWCSDEMFTIEPVSDDLPNPLVRNIIFDQPLCFTSDGKIGVLPP